jgi:putative ABC transport system substrate-binding protein
MTVTIGRRELLAALGGAVAAWPLKARAQQPAKQPLIGMLVPGTRATHGQWFAALVDRLRELGWIEGRTIAFEYRFAEGRTDRAAEIVAEFVRMKVDLIATSAADVTLAAKQVTSAIPIVSLMSSTLALGARIATICGFREYVEVGALMSYGPNLPALFRRAGEFVDKILRGAKPGDIPVEQPTKFDLIINLTTAKALGLTIVGRQHLSDRMS